MYDWDHVTCWSSDKVMPGNDESGAGETTLADDHHNGNVRSSSIKDQKHVAAATRGDAWEVVTGLNFFKNGLKRSSPSEIGALTELSEFATVKAVCGDTLFFYSILCFLVLGLFLTSVHCHCEIVLRFRVINFIGK